MLRLSLVDPTPLATVIQQTAAIREFDTAERLTQVRTPTLSSTVTPIACCRTTTERSSPV